MAPYASSSPPNVAFAALLAAALVAVMMPHGALSSAAPPDASKTCAYSAIGFNPWEVYNVVAFEGDSVFENTNIGTRIAAHNLQLDGTTAVHSAVATYITPMGNSNAGQFSVSATGDLKFTSGSAMVLNGGVEVGGFFSISSGTSVTVDGDVNVLTESCMVQSGLITGAVKVAASINITIAEVRGDVYTNMGAGISSAAKTGGIHAAGFVEVTSASIVTGNVHAGSVVRIEGGSSVTGNVIAGTGLTVEMGGTVNGNTFSPSSPIVVNGGTITGAKTVGATAPPEALTLAMVTDHTNIRAYFAARSAEWKEQTDSFVSKDLNVEDANPANPNNRLTIRVHGRVNYVSSVTREDLASVSNIVLEGHPQGVVIINVGGAALFSLMFKEVFYRGADGQLQVPSFGRVLFNIYEATEVSLSGIHFTDMTRAVRASVLAPQAEVTTGMGPSWLAGNVVGKKFTVGGPVSTIDNLPFGTSFARLSNTPRPANKPTKLPVGNGAAWCLWHAL